MLSPIDNTASGLKEQISNEIKDYTTRVVSVGEAYDYSQFKLVRRITLFESHTYPTGKFDSQGNYKFWYDGISSRIENEVKNIDFDTKDVKLFSDRSPSDDLPVLIANLKLLEYMREKDMDTEFNEAVEEGSGWGNIVWKKVKGTFERVDLKNFYVINQTAKTLDETPVIERHQMTSSDLRAKIGIWDNVKEVLEQNKSKLYKSQLQNVATETTVPYYEIFERNGEVCLKDLKEAHGEEVMEGDSDIYVFAKIIGAAETNSTSLSPTINFILFAEENKGKTNCDLYQEFHRGVYKGKWFREGMYELLFDLQVRLNQIGNQLAQALELSSKTILRSGDKLIVQNILTDMRNGDVLKAADLEQVQLTSTGIPQLIAEWNLIQQQMNDIANSSPIVTGEGIPQRMAFQLAALLNQNSNKLFDYIRQKLSIPFTVMFEKWVVPAFIKELSGKEILRLTGDPKMLDRLYTMIANDWYVSNLLNIGPHGQDVAEFLIQQQIEELKKRPALLMKGLQETFKNFKPSVSCVIAGENSTLPQDMQTYSTFITLEQDPIRRTALIEMAMAKKGIDTANLPKTETPAGGPGQPGMQPPPEGKTAPINGAPESPSVQPPPKRAGRIPLPALQH